MLPLIVLFDLWNINMKYVNEDNFTRASKVKTPFTINEIDKQIRNLPQFTYSWFALKENSNG